MIPILRRTAFALVATGLAAGAASAQGGLDALAGSWESEPTVADAVRTRVSASWVLGSAWLRLEVEDAHASGRLHREHLMLRQGENGSVSGYLFTADLPQPLRFTGGWTGDAELRLAGPRQGDDWLWRRESACSALLARASADGEARLRAGDSRLRSSECEPIRTAEKPAAATPEAGGERADGRPVGSTPDAASAEAPEEPIATTAAADPAPAASRDDDRTAAGEAEVQVAELPAARPVAAATDPGAPDPGRKVILAGRGKPLDEVQKAIVLLREFLAARGVAVEGPSDEIVVLQEADASLAYLVREVRDRGAASLLYVSAAFGGRERISVECYDGNGLLLWKEKTVGGTAMRELRWMNPRLVERIQEKLEPRIGGVGLPAGDPGSS